MYSKSAAFYSAIYDAVGKDYKGETRQLRRIIKQHMPSASNLLDVACGDGAHLRHLRHYYNVEGLDISEDMIQSARENNPGITFHQGDMISFDLGKSYDVITCLFSSIGYVKSRQRLRAAVRNMTRHLRPGGLLIIEPWFTPGSYEPGDKLYSVSVDRPDLKLLRVNFPEKTGNLSKMIMHYLVATPQGIHYFKEKHLLGLFELDEYRRIMEENNLLVSFSKKGLTGRGLFTGILQEENNKNE